MPGTWGTPPAPRDATLARQWWVRVGAIVAAALVIRVLYVVIWQNPTSFPVDALYYHFGANDLANGYGFTNPLVHHFSGVIRPGADHPPGLIVVLSVPSILGLQSALAHQLWSCLLGSTTVVLVALIGRMLAGGRAGLVAAVIAATYPGFWTNDAYLMPETLAMLFSALAVYLAYRALRKPSVALAVALGAVVAAAALTRAEMLLLLLLLVLPVLLVGGENWRRRLGLSAVAGATTLVLIMPWAIYTSIRLDHPELLSVTEGVTLAGSNCGHTYYGPDIGDWSQLCSTRAARQPGDVSDIDQRSRRVAYRYARAHLSHLPVVVLARLGRTFGFFRPVSSHQGDVRREKPVAIVMLLFYWFLVVASVAGALYLRRARVRIWPLLSLIVLSAIVTITTYGNVRFRATADVAFVVFAAAALDRLLARRSRALSANVRMGRPSEAVPAG